MKKLRFLLGFAMAAVTFPAFSDTATFDDLPLDAESFFAGPTANATVVAGPFGPSLDGTFTSGGVQFSNHYDQTFFSSTGFAYSNTTDSTTGSFSNQYSAYPGTGAGPGADNYGIAFGHQDLTANDFDPVPFDPNNPAEMYQLPNITLPAGFKIQSMAVTNTTYTALTMKNGDGFGFSKAFGGPTGNDADYLLLTAYGTDAAGVLLGSADFYLADYRFADNSLDYIVNTWTTWDLTALGNASRIYFNLASTDIGQFGMNTPGYFAADNLLIAAVPEPSSAALMLVAVIALIPVVRHRFRRRGA
jgi:hypothetical protein